MENKEHKRALETPAESEQISEKAGNKVDDIHEERTDVTCVESNDNKEYERAQGSYSVSILVMMNFVNVVLTFLCMYSYGEI